MLRVFSRPKYIVLAALAAFAIFFSTLWFPEVPLIGFYLSDPTFSDTDIYSLVTQILLSSIIGISLIELIYIAMVAVLVGINFSLFVFYLRMYRSAPSVTGVAGGFLGTVFAFLGFGCASCGTIFLSTLSVAASGVGLYALSPYLGIGLGITGTLMLLLSAVLLSRAINKPPVCPI